MVSHSRYVFVDVSYGAVEITVGLHVLSSVSNVPVDAQKHLKYRCDVVTSDHIRPFIAPLKNRVS